MKQTRTAPNRRIRAAWLTRALELASSGSPAAESERLLLEDLKQEMKGSESLKKSAMYLRKIWLQPEPEIDGLTHQAIKLYTENRNQENAIALSYFMWLANYPFAREVAESVGKLIRLQGSFKSEQVYRHMCGLRGQRETVRRSAQYAIRLLVDFGYILELTPSGAYAPDEHKATIDPAISEVCLEALFQSTPARGHFRKRELETHPALFSINGQALVDCALAGPQFKISRESYSEIVVSLR